MEDETNFTPHERPKWCPHQDCVFVLNTQSLACVGRLPEPVDHDGAPNDGRLCIKAGEVFDLQVNRGDLWGLGRLFKKLYPPAVEEPKKAVLAERQACAKIASHFTIKSDASIHPDILLKDMNVMARTAAHSTAQLISLSIMEQDKKEIG